MSAVLSEHGCATRRVACEYLEGRRCPLCTTHTVDAAFLDRFRAEWARLDRDAPTMPPRIYDRSFTKVMNRKPSPEAFRADAPVVTRDSEASGGASPS